MTHTPLLPLYRVICILWGHFHISIWSCCCDGLSCGVILTEMLWTWGSLTDYYGRSSLLFIIKWLPVPFLGLGHARRDVPSLCLSHSYMKSVVSGGLGSLLLPTLFMVCVFYTVRQNVLTGTHCIPCLTDISLLCGWTIGPHQASLCPLASSGLYLLFKKYQRASLSVHDTFFI